MQKIAYYVLVQVPKMDGCDHTYAPWEQAVCRYMLFFIYSSCVHPKGVKYISVLRMYCMYPVCMKEETSPPTLGW